MNNIQKYNSDKATVCADKNCLTVYGDTAKLINIMAVVAVFLILGTLVIKALK